MFVNRQFFRCFSLLMPAFICIGLLFGCAGKPQADAPDFQQTATNSIEIEQLNEQLNLSSSNNKSLSGEGYKITVGDVLKVQVFQVEDLSQSYQVGSRGMIYVPLLGEMRVKGLRIDEVQRLLSVELSKNLLKNPQVTVSIEEYSPQHVTVMGAVLRPDIYQITQGRNVYEMLTLAGGFAKNAGQSIYLKTIQSDYETGALESITMTVETRDLFNPESIQAIEMQQNLKNLLFGDGDSIYVAKAGVVYVDGPIAKPGKYALEGETTVTQLLAIAGGGKFTSSEKKVRVLRRVSGKMEILEVNVPRIRSGKDSDVLLKGGDIVTIGTSAFKTATKGFFDYFLRLVFLF